MRRESSRRSSPSTWRAIRRDGPVDVATDPQEFDDGDELRRDPAELVGGPRDGDQVEVTMRPEILCFYPAAPTRPAYYRNARRLTAAGRLIYRYEPP